MTDPFETLIDQLSKSLHIPLHVDHNHACALKVHQKLVVQLQTDASQEKLFIASMICELLPGKFRENVLTEALKANHLPDPRTGILSYLARTNHLTLHQSYPIASLDGSKLEMLLAGFIDYADLWREAIEQGKSSPAPIATSSSNPFGLKR